MYSKETSANGAVPCQKQLVIMTTMAKSSHFRQIHSEPATISSIHTDLNNLQMKDTKFDLPNVINGSPTTKNVYNPPLREQLLREHLTHHVKSLLKAEQAP
ncbi:hypothetical protein Tcan_15444 [Toxocara canis]|uniref:Uncharacterized protein n=1 Tax=Toxocara canis TaxID=6265 RepID=A0A0B2VJ65_TOXCA|nr:hypothetical protein Tcan_15444 [Toxocara canis]